MGEGGRRRVTLSDVARLADVSPSAVSRAFTDGASVSKETRARIVRAADRLGYRPNALARSLMTGRSALIGLVSNALVNPFIMNVVDAFTLQLQRRRLRPLVFNLSGDFSIDDTVTLIRQYQLDGVIVASSTLDPDFAEAVAAAGVPVVIAFGAPRPGSSISAAHVDNVEGGRLVAEALVRRGYRRAGFIGGGEDVSTTQDRLAGFRAALADAGLVEPAVVHAGRYAQAAGFAAASKLVAQAPDLDAVFCADDLLAIGAFDALRAMGRAAPETGIVGFNDIQMASWPAFDLSTVRAPVDQVVAGALDMLSERIDAPGRPPERRIVGCEFVPRSTLRKLLEQGR